MFARWKASPYRFFLIPAALYLVFAAVDALGARSAQHNAMFNEKTEQASKETMKVSGMLGNQVSLNIGLAIMYVGLSIGLSQISTKNRTRDRGVLRSSP